MGFQDVMKQMFLRIAAGDGGDEHDLVVDVFHDLRGFCPYIRRIDRLGGHQEHHGPQECIIGRFRRGEPGPGFLSCRGRCLQFVFQSQFVDLL